MKGSLRSNTLVVLASVAVGGCATCGPGTIESDGSGWRFDRDEGFFGGFENNFKKVCLPVGTVSDCTDFQMVEEDGGGWRIDRDGGGWRIDRDGGGWRYDRDGGGWRRERDEPHHPGDAGDPPGKILYVPTGVCRVGVPAPPDV